MKLTLSDVEFGPTLARLGTPDPRPAYHQRVAANIRELAWDKGVSLNQLSGLAGVSRSALTYVLRGDQSPTLDWLVGVAEALDVDVIRLLKEFEVEGK